MLSQGQRAAVLQAATAPVLVLTGGPGCGKTTTTKHIVSMWHKLGKAVNLCAPTGKLTGVAHRDATLEWLTCQKPCTSTNITCGCAFGCHHSCLSQSFCTCSQSELSCPTPPLISDCRLQSAAGRASQRLQEASQHPSETIHRMLGWKTKGAHNEKDDDSSSSSRYRFNHTAVSRPVICQGQLCRSHVWEEVPCLQQATACISVAAMTALHHAGVVPGVQLMQAYGSMVQTPGPACSTSLWFDELAACRMTP